jgi:hypothetical protein
VSRLRPVRKTAISPLLNSLLASLPLDLCGSSDLWFFGPGGAHGAHGWPLAAGRWHETDTVGHSDHQPRSSVNKTITPAGPVPRSVGRGPWSARTLGTGENNHLLTTAGDTTSGQQGRARPRQAHEPRYMDPWSNRQSGRAVWRRGTTSSEGVTWTMVAVGWLVTGSTRARGLIDDALLSPGA